MAKRERLGLTAVRTEGAILPASILQRIHREDPGLDGLKPEQYDLTGDRLREAASRAWTALQGPWMNFKAERAKLAPSEAGTTITRNRWLYPILRELHFGPLEPLRESLKYDEKEFPVSHKFGHSPLHLIGCNLALDKRTPGAVGAAKMSPHGLLQSCLNSTRENLWGFVTNGLQWRVLRDDNSLSRQSMVEFDLESIFEGQLYDEFLLFFLVCHRSRVQSELPEECWLEKWSQAAGEDGKRALNTLRDGVQKSIEALGQGFLRHPANSALRTRIRNGELDKQDYYRQLLRMVYRLLFLFVAEDRGLLLDPKSMDTAKALFNEHFSTQRLRLLAERMRGSIRHHDLFNPLKMVLSKLGEPAGCPELALPALGGFLFSESTAPDLDSAEIANADLLEAIRFLAVTREGGRLARVDYKNLGTEELGSVYESLLELHPDLASDGTWFELKTASGNERKTSGSYYTPDSLIQCLLDTALDPVVNEAVKKAGTDTEARAKAILELRVIDPAVGSGHFLIAASHRLAKRLAQVRTGEDEPSPDATRHALREVVGKCLFGIDLNPMAAELCKVSLWIEALEPGLSLSFLDHHIIVGNSLLGATQDLLLKGIPDEAFKQTEFDDGPIVRTLKRRNAGEREGQGNLFEPEMKSSEIVLKLWKKLESTDDSSLPGSLGKARIYDDVLVASQADRIAADSWCSAFLTRKLAFNADDPRSGFDVTTASLRGIQSGSELQPYQLRLVEECAREHSLIHLHLSFPGVFESGGFDVILGNPPFVNVIENRREPQTVNFVGFRWPTIKGTSDIAYHFFALALDILKPRGFAALLQPRQALNAPATQAWRESISPRQPRLLGIVQDHRIFAGASVHVAMIALGPAGSCQLIDFQDGRITSESMCDEVIGSNWWSLLSGAEGSGNSSTIDSGPTVGDHFDVAASMTTGDAYAIKEFLIDDESEPGQRLVTTGLIDPGLCLWGVDRCRYLKDIYNFPRLPFSEKLPGTVARRLEKSRRPKILVAGLSKVLECFLDLDGTHIGAVATFSIYHPADDIDQLKALVDIIHRPVESVRLARELGASRMGGSSSITVTKDFLKSIPLHER